jgi:hypothetical protein
MTPSPTPPNPRKSIVPIILLAIFGIGGLFWIVLGNLSTTYLTTLFKLGEPQLDCKQQGDKARKELKSTYGIDFELIQVLKDSFEVCDAERVGGTAKDKLVLTVKSKVDNRATKQIRASIDNLDNKTIEKRASVSIDDSDNCMAWKSGKEYKLQVYYQRGETRVIRFLEKSCEN